MALCWSPQIHPSKANFARAQTHCTMDANTIIPQEISDYMMGFAKNDPSSLKACGLVCKSWLYSSRSHLFRSIVLGRDNADSFSSLVMSIHSTIPVFVKTLRLSPEEHDSRWFQLLAPFLQDLNATTSIILENINWTGINVFARSNFLAHFGPSLTELELKNLKFLTFADVVDVLCEFPLLQSLSLIDVSWGTSRCPSDASRERALKDLPTPHLTKLVLRNCVELRSVLLWLLSHKSIPAVPSIEVGPLREGEVILSGRYLRFIGPRLLHLNMTFQLVGPVHTCFIEPMPITADLAKLANPQIIRDLEAADKRYGAVETELINEQGRYICGNLAALISLRTLHMGNFITHTDPERTSATFWVPKVLISIRSPYLERVTFDLELCRAGEADIHSINWSFIDRVLTEGRKENLKKVEITYRGAIKHKVVEELISSKWPACRAAGKLSFT